MRLIDADELLRAYDKAHEGEPGKARQLIEDAPTVSGWISVVDRVPDKYLDVLVYVQCPDNSAFVPYTAIAWKSTNDGSWDSDNQDLNDDPDGIVTHWMPLPDAPK